jgi:hypothetical protein
MAAFGLSAPLDGETTKHENNHYPLLGTANLGADLRVIGRTPGRYEKITSYVIGVGQDSCGKYLRAADAERKARPNNADPAVLYSPQFVAFVSYVNGYLTGANFMAAAYHLPQGQVGEKSEMDGRMVWLENYCKSQLLNVFSNAVFSLMAGLSNENR